MSNKINFFWDHHINVQGLTSGVGNFKNCGGITGLFSFRQGCVWRKTEWHGELESRVATPTARVECCGCGYARLAPTHAQQFRDEVTARRCIEASLSLDLGGKNYGLWRILFLSVAQLWRQFCQLPTPEPKLRTPHFFQSQMAHLCTFK